MTDDQILDLINEFNKPPQFNKQLLTNFSDLHDSSKYLSDNIYYLLKGRFKSLLMIKNIMHSLYLAIRDES